MKKAADKIDWKKIASEIESKFSLKVSMSESLADLTTFGLGGPAKLFVRASRREEMVELVRFCKKKKLPFFILGGGSNILVSDEGFNGVVIKSQMDKIKILGFGGKIRKEEVTESNVLVQVESGVSFNRLVRYLINEGIGGLESFLGLPGTVGGAIYGNAHYEDKFVGDYVTQGEVLDEKGDLRTITKDDFKFFYNDSVLKGRNWVLLKVVFKLSFSSKDELWSRAERALRDRKNSQPYEEKSAGCVFGNISADQAKNGSIQSVGYLIDKAGLKGERAGGAMVSVKHANFIINTKDAKAVDVLELITLVKKRVKEKFGVNLEFEIGFVGFDKIT